MKTILSLISLLTRIQIRKELMPELIPVRVVTKIQRENHTHQ